MHLHLTHRSTSPSTPLWGTTSLTPVPYHTATILGGHLTFFWYLYQVPNTPTQTPLTQVGTRQFRLDVLLVTAQHSYVISTSSYSISLLESDHICWIQTDTQAVKYWSLKHSANLKFSNSTLINAKCNRFPSQLSFLKYQLRTHLYIIVYKTAHKLSYW